MNTIQMLFVLMLSIGLMNHVIIIPVLLEIAGRDAWISTVIGLILLVMFLPLIYFPMKQSQQTHIFQWLKENIGAPIAYFIASVTCLYLLIISIVTLKDTTTFTTTSYLTGTPNWAIIATLCIICFYNASIGLPSIAKTSGIILPFVVLFGIFVALATIPHKNYELLKPMLENGWMPVWKGVMYVATGYGEIVLLLFMQQQMKTNISFMKLVLFGLVAASLSIGPTIGAITEFGPAEASHLRYPAFEQWRMVNLGAYLEHFDFLSVYQWLAGAFIRISLATALIPELFDITNKASRRWILIFVYVVIFFAAMTPISDYTFFHMLKKWILPISFFFICFLSTSLFVLALAIRIKERRASA
ncbi:GerAB/ArcD/ProY family transporter [Anoxybacillus ayderensis]|uniref:GerAB/ArcD/ProY family transporter n=1 Tax=Anoxybacillus ayderensis TaxID=265546 RepID=UPI000A271814|nr:endospore germination permease [Anoxybacillus ayderensis]OSX53772.1 spore gernimation protein [Anoxybacillus ayderensis]